MNRFVDRGAVIAGWIGAGMAMVVVIALGLVIPLASLLVLSAVPVGAAIGAYANVRSQRHWPRRRMLFNAAWAGAVTAAVLAGSYVVIRLTFLYLDSGRLPSDRQLDCVAGPDCVYTRLIELGFGQEMAANGIIDAATFEAAWLAGLLATGALLVALTVGAALAAGLVQALTGWSRPEPAVQEQRAGEG